MDATQADSSKHAATVAAKLAATLPEGCQHGATLWIDNAWQTATRGETFQTDAPRNGERLISLSLARNEDVDRAVTSARRALVGWRTMGGSHRSRILRQMAEEIQKHAEEFAFIEALDSGRPIRDTQHSAHYVADMLHFYAGLADKIQGKSVPVGGGRTTMIEYEPCGVIGAVTPWNYPLPNALTKIAPILACGNTLVLKPAELTPLVTLLLAEVMCEAGLPAGVVNIISGDGQTGAALVAHPGIDKVSFTGSTATGRRIAQSAGEGLKGCVLELGGKSPLIIFDDADLNKAADAAVFTTFTHQGQTCTSCNRVLVAQGIRDRFVALCRAKLASIRIGDPLDPDIQVGAIVSKGQIERMSGLMAGAEALPMDLTNYRPVEGGWYFRPMIVDVKDSEARYLREEIFGPVMTIQSFEEDDEAYTLANDSQYGLAASIWTGSLARAERARRDIEAGVVWINCVHDLSWGTPVSGHKASGMGSEYGLEAINNYMRIKATVQMYGDWNSPFSVD